MLMANVSGPHAKSHRLLLYSVNSALLYKVEVWGRSLTKKCSDSASPVGISIVGCIPHCFRPVNPGVHRCYPASYFNKERHEIYHRICQPDREISQIIKLAGRRNLEIVGLQGWFLMFYHWPRGSTGRYGTAWLTQGFAATHLRWAKLQFLPVIM